MGLSSRSLRRFTSVGYQAGHHLPAGADVAINVGGTTNLAPLVKQAATAYQGTHAGVTITVKGTSSGAGIASLKSHAVDVAMSDVAVSDPDFSDTVLGVVGFAFMVNPDVGIKNLTHQDAIALYSGKVTNWKQIGGNDQKVVLIGRDIGTGTRFVVEEKVARLSVPMTIEKNAVAVVKAVAATPGSIGYLASGFIGDRQDLVISYDGVAPSESNIVSHAYPVSTDEHLYTQKGASADITAFVQYVKDDKPVLRANGVFR
jgi:phosphate transport system substrate-binding protein